MEYEHNSTWAYLHLPLHMIDLSSTSSCKGMVTTGEGKFYSNGLDLDWMETIDSDALLDFYQDYTKLLFRLLTFPLPTVAAINGENCPGKKAFPIMHSSVPDSAVTKQHFPWNCKEALDSKGKKPVKLKCLTDKVSLTTWCSYC